MRHPTQGAKVLLIDEDLGDLRYYGKLLRALGFDVVTAYSHEEGMFRLESDKFSFVIVSQGGPAFEGRCFLERAVEIDRTMPVLVLSRCLDPQCYIEAMQLGAVDYVPKHVQPNDLVWIIETHLKRPAAG